MAKYPVEIGDDEGTADAINYLLSGPSGLGQNFAGFSSYSPVKYLTGNFRIPFSQSTPSNLKVGPIPISNAVVLDDRTIQYFFSGAPLASVPFALGNGLTITDVVPTGYNTAYLRQAGTGIQQIGVVECTDSYVIVRTVAPITIPIGSYVSGGNINYSVMDTYNSTDCDVRVTVTGGTDRVFVSAQLDQLIDYTTPGTEDLTVYVAINRYKAFINDNPTNPDYIFEFDGTIVEKQYDYTGLTGTGTLPLIDTIFTSIVDRPLPGYYRYIVEVYFYTYTSVANIFVTNDQLQVRSISAQVVKQ